MTIKQKTQLLT